MTEDLSAITRQAGDGTAENDRQLQAEMIGTGRRGLLKTFIIACVLLVLGLYGLIKLPSLIRAAQAGPTTVTEKPPTLTDNITRDPLTGTGLVAGTVLERQQPPFTLSGWIGERPYVLDKNTPRLLHRGDASYGMYSPPNAYGSEFGTDRIPFAFKRATGDRRDGATPGSRPGSGRSNLSGR